MPLDELLNSVKVVAVLCNQWGDSGKGKFSDYFASNWAEVSARGTGGDNAGHTVLVNGKETVSHILPVGIHFDSNGMITVLGNGMNLNINGLSRELDELAAENVTCNHLMISQDANVIMPYHIARDKLRDQSQAKGGIGSTGRGMGPCYTDKIARRGVRVIDMLDRDALSRKIKTALEFYPEYNGNVADIVEQLKPDIERISPFIRDTVQEMHRFLREGKRILLEGAQGLLLSIEHGTYPFVTSSDCSLNGTASGVGISAKAVDLPIGIVKFPYMTRVGGGPFPTELGGNDGRKHCADDTHRKVYELEQFGITFSLVNGKPVYNPRDEKILQMINSQDEFTRGVGIRLAGKEYGATTGRPRRVGWTDAVAARYAVGINGPIIALTKVDVMAGADNFNICYGYEADSSTHTDFNKDSEFLDRVKPVYKKYEGFSSVSHKLSGSLQTAIDDFERFTNGHVVAVSIGPDRDDTIIR